MRYNKSNGEFMFKVIIATTLGVLILVSSFIMSYQKHQIDQLKTDLYLKEQVETRKSDKTISIVNMKTIQEKMNELQNYSVLKNSKVSMTHTYIYEKPSILGLTKRVTLKGTANLVYNYDISLANAEITQDAYGTITIKIDSPALDIESVHYDRDTLIWQENNYNLLCNEDDGQQATKYFLESFVEQGTVKIQDMYNDKHMREQLDRVAVLEVQELIEGLNLNNCTVIVKIK